MTSKVFRVDSFVVPAAAKAEFVAQVHRTHELLRTLPGFVQEQLLEQDSSSEACRIVTLVEWSGADALESARAEVMKFRAREGTDPRQLMARLGVQADLGEFRPLVGPSID